MVIPPSSAKGVVVVLVGGCIKVGTVLSHLNPLLVVKVVLAVDCVVSARRHPEQVALLEEAAASGATETLNVKQGLSRLHHKVSGADVSVALGATLVAVVVCSGRLPAHNPGGKSEDYIDM